MFKMDIVLDFDGTCVTHHCPGIGNDIGAIQVLKHLVSQGHRLILFTMRSGDELKEAISWFKKNNIELFGVQSNPDQSEWTSSPKAYGHLIIDDTALGCPLKWDSSLSHRPFIDWVKVRQWLVNRGLLPAT